MVWAANLSKTWKRRRTSRHPVKVTALWNLKEALLNEVYEDCPLAIKIAKEYLQNKEYDYTYDSKSKTSTEFLKNGNYEYNYEIDWDHPRIRLEQKALKKDGSLTGGFGVKVLVWYVWFLPLDGIDLEGKRDVVGVDIDAKTGKVFTKYSWSKI